MPRTPERVSKIKTTMYYSLYINILCVPIRTAQVGFFVCLCSHTHASVPPSLPLVPSSAGSMHVHLWAPVCASLIATATRGEIAGQKYGRVG